jgi:hypothetical protein
MGSGGHGHVLATDLSLNSLPVPKGYAPAGLQNDTVIATINGDDLAESFLDQMPDWFEPPVAQGVVISQSGLTRLKLSTAGDGSAFYRQLEYIATMVAMLTH